MGFEDERDKWSAALTLINKRGQFEGYDTDVDSLLARLSGIMLTHIHKSCWEDIMLSAAYGENAPYMGCHCDLQDDELEPDDD